MQIKKLFKIILFSGVFIYLIFTRLQKYNGDPNQLIYTIFLLIIFLILFAPSLFDIEILQEIRMYFYSAILFGLTIWLSLRGIKIIITNPSSLLFAIPATIIANAAVYLFIIKKAKKTKPSTFFQTLLQDNFAKIMILISMLILQISLFATQKNTLILAFIPAVISTSLLKDFFNKDNSRNIPPTSL